MAYLFVSDYDRTLADEKDGFVIRENLAEFINHFSSKYPFFVVTGRERRFISRLAPTLKPTGWVLENGAIILYGEKTYINAPKNWAEIRKEIIKRLEEKEIKYSVGEIIVYVNNIDSSSLDLHLESAKVEWNRNDAMILPKDVDKGRGVLFIKNLLNFKGKVIALGDSQNDIPLFRVADVKVAVSNALPEIKEIADVVLDKPNGQGIIDFLSKILSDEIFL